MVSNQNFSRINTLELKDLLVKKIGLQRGERYFDQLGRLFSLKISKFEFDKFCIRTIGRENIPLHNNLIKSIIKNASVAKVPPPKGNRKVGRNTLQSIYGDAFSPSPRKGRSLVSRDRKFRDRPSPLGPLGKPQSMVACEESVSKTPDQQSPTELHSLDSRPPVEVVSVEDGEEVEQVAWSPSVQSRSPVTAPLGISMNLGGTRKTFSNLSISDDYYPVTCQNSSELPDTRSLTSRLEQKLELEGINVMADCVNLLNNGLDAYLRRLIEPCMALAASGCGNKHPNQLGSPLTPGLSAVSYMHTPTQPIYGSMLDFRTAMELDPKVLGGDWPIQLEKICLRASEE
ncbi:hypothetical protein LWI29_033023 [Acer saccharum]|uniref:Transcriptional coactivator Hfi1/Transcriptional adapter 1 n=1 Tax=Acer saccharum TaxID=4024 RepID=A0AA39S1B6_ACESA|nr:hypothetical protein LWI29_033023 [Acer saccharum]KAK1558418.1 hypothetical protein Q3G72_002083 [Acer saccharum]